MQHMKLILAGASALALVAGNAFAERPANDPGFNKLDANKDGYLTRTEAARNPDLVKNFKQADKNGDGKLSRTEYLTVMTKKDLSTAKQKITGKKDKDKSAATGGTKSSR
jgi:Ca2+-binding EF-hand superfamily protein